MKQTAPKSDAPKGGRLMSLDALRGFDMLFIMGGAGMLAPWPNGSPAALPKP